MSAEKRPEWLPDGWIMEVRTRKSGNKDRVIDKKDRFYTSPVSGYTFRSKGEVLRYLNVEKVTGHTSKPTSSVGDKKKQFVAKLEGSPEWLPTGWILEIKTHMSGANAGRKYKCYFDPFTGSRFYSKGDVFRHLKGGKSCSPTSNKKRRIKTNSTDNVLAQFEYSPDGLPHGWIKEIKFRRTGNAKNGIRKDPYYTDPVSGYVFRSLKDVLRYIETGEVSKHAYRSTKRSISDMYSLERESPPPIAAKKLKSQGAMVRRCLFTGQIPTSNGKTVVETDTSPGNPQTPLLEHASAQCEEGADSSCLAPSTAKHLKGKAKKVSSENQLNPEFHADGLPREPMLEREKLLELEKLAAPVNVKPLNQMPPDPLEKQQLDSADGKLLAELQHKNPLEPANLKLLEAENEKPHVPECTSMEPENLTSSGLEEKLLEAVNEKPSPLEEKQLNHMNEKQLQPALESPDKVVKKQGSRYRLGSCKAKTKKAVSSPLRASKRLAGLEAGPVADFGIGDRSLWGTAKRSAQLKANPAKHSDPIASDQPSDQPKAVPATDLVHSEKLKSKETLGENAVPIIDPVLSETIKSGEPLVEQAGIGEQLGAGKITDDWSESSLALPFGDSWPDPCIEFAFRTLTSDIPVLDDGTAIEEYFQHQLISVQSPSPCSASLTFGSPESFSQAELLVQHESPDERRLSVKDDGRPCSLDNGIPSSGKVSKETRRSARLNQ